MKSLSSEAFAQAVTRCIAKQVDFVLIAGDLFNNALPAIDTVKACVRQLKKLKDAHIPVYLIGGSHDYAASGKTMLDVLEEADLLVNVMKGAVMDDTLALEFTTDPHTGVKLTGILGKRGMLDKAYYEQLDKTPLEQEGGFKIFLFHTALSEFKPSGKDAMESAPLALLPKGFNYYAGGHVHMVFQKEEPGYGKIVYPGPLFPASFAELEELKHGGFYLFDDGHLVREEIRLKPVTAVNLDLENHKPEEVFDLVRQATEEGVHNHVVLLRMHGQLRGKITDIPFRDIFRDLYDRGAFFVMKNTSKLLSESFEQVKVEAESPDKIEEVILKQHAGQSGMDCNEVDLAKKLIKVLNREKHEGEKQYEYEARIKKEASEVLGW